MKTTVHVLLADDDFSVAVSWRKGGPPERNDALIKQLWGLPHTLVVPSYGQTSLIVDAGSDVELHQVRKVFHDHGYRTAKPVVI